MKHQEKPRKNPTSLKSKTIAYALIASLSNPLLTGCASFMQPQSDVQEPADEELGFESEEVNQDLAAEELGESQLGTQTTISDLRYVSRRGGGTVVIETSTPATFRTRENTEQNQFVIDIANAVLPARLKRPYITKEFGQSIASVNAYQDAGTSSASIVIQFKQPTRATVTQSGRRLLIFAAEPLPANGQPMTLDDSGEIESIAKAASIEGGSTDPRILPGMSDGLDSGKYYGRPISIEVRDMPVADVINLISEQSGVNIVMSGESTGKISLKLKQIPWDQALMIVMKTQGLGYVRQGSVLRIAPNQALQTEANQAREILEAQRRAEPLRVQIVPVSYAKPTDMIARIKPFLTPQRGDAVADLRTSSIIITDTAEMIERAKNLIRSLDTPPLQVLIEGKIVEASEGFSQSWGIDWSLGGGNPSTLGNVNLGINNFGVATGVPQGTTLDLTLGTFDLFGDLNARLGLAESENLVKVISSPRVTTLNNEAASIESNLTIQVASPATTTTTGAISPPTFTPLQIPLTLNVTPQVTTEGDVLMDVSINRSIPVPSSSGPPQVSSRSAKTKVMVRNGQTAVIGGVYQNDITEAETGVPYLRNIPIFGWLFKSRQTTNTKNELLLFLTPRVINAEKGLSKESTL